MRIRTIVFVLGLAWAAIPAGAQIAEEFNPPRAACCLINNARALADQLQDWNQLGRYHADNEKLKADGRVSQSNDRWAL